MKHYTNKMKTDGELAVRGLSEKARNLYDGTDPFHIYEYRDECNKKIYAFSGCLGHGENMTFKELEEKMEALYDDCSMEEV